MTILLDMDDVLTTCVTVWIDILNKKYGRNVQYTDVLYWDFSLLYPKLTREQILEPLGMEEFWNRVEPIKDAQKYVEQLQKLGNRIVVVTASYPSSYQYKGNVIHKFFPFIDLDDIVVAHNKSLVKGDVLVDDNPKNFSDDRYGILFTAPHNKNYKTDNKKIFRADTWEDVYKLICHMG